VMIAMAIIAIAVTAVFKMQSQTTTLVNGTRFYTLAPLLAQQKMAEIQTGLVGEATEGSGSFDEPHTDFSWQYTTEAIESETLGKVAEDLRRIDVTVTSDVDESTFALREYAYR
jgi:general secretion pathway protein I